MKYALFIATLVSAFLLTSCSKEKQTEKMLYGEWEVSSFLHGANDLTQLYKDSCGCRMVFQNYYCLLKCPYNGWNYYFSDSLTNFPWKNDMFFRTRWSISKDGSKIDWFFGNRQPDSIYRWGMFPLTIRINPDEIKSVNSFFIEEISKERLTFMFTDSITEIYNIQLSKIKE